LTGDVTGVTTGVANNFKALQSFSNGISASGGITFNGILNIGQMLSYGGTDDITIGNMAASTVEIGKLSNSALLSVQGDAASIALITDAFSVTATNVVFNNSNITGKLVTSLNGKTGALQGVCAINGLTGTVGLSAGTGIDMSVSGNTITITNTSPGSPSSNYIPDLTPLGNTADIITMRNSGWTVSPINTIATPLLIKGGTALPGSIVNIKIVADGSVQTLNLGTGTWFYTYMVQRPGLGYSTEGDPAVIIDYVTDIISSNSNITITPGGLEDDLFGHAIKLSGNTSGVVNGGGLGPQ
jgi:hypothetical protein